MKLAHDNGATIQDFKKNLKGICSRYTDAITNISNLLEIEIKNPVNCMRLIMRHVGIKQKLRNEVVGLFVAQNGTEPCTAHDLYFAINEAGSIHFYAFTIQ